LFAIGYLYGLSQSPENQVGIYEQALEASPKYHLARLGLVNYYMRVQWNAELALQNVEALLQQGEVELMSARYWTSSPLEPKDLYALARFKRAVILVNIGKHQKAIEDFDFLVQRYPKYGDYLAQRASVHLTNRNFELAIADADRAAKLQNDCACALPVKLWSLLNLNQPVAAEKLADELLTNPVRQDGWGETYYIRGIVKKRTNRPESALQDLETSFNFSKVNLARVLTQLIQFGYYEGDVRDDYSQRARNGLEACLLDPGCMV
jgi:tetratricopeptide (TPR) repeat protein